MALGETEFGGSQQMSFDPSLEGKSPILDLATLINTKLSNIPAASLAIFDNYGFYSIPNLVNTAKATNLANVVLVVLNT
jgi:hypothetical protein